MLCNEIGPRVSQVIPSHRAKSHDFFWCAWWNLFSKCDSIFIVYEHFLLSDKKCMLILAFQSRRFYVIFQNAHKNRHACLLSSAMSFLLFKVCVNRKLLPTLFQCNDVFPAETEYWIEGRALFLRSSSRSLTHSNLTVGVVCLRIFCPSRQTDVIREGFFFSGLSCMG